MNILASRGAPGGRVAGGGTGAAGVGNVAAGVNAFAVASMAVRALSSGPVTSTRTVSVSSNSISSPPSTRILRLLSFSGFKVDSRFSFSSLVEESRLPAVVLKETSASSDSFPASSSSAFWLLSLRSDVASLDMGLLFGFRIWTSS